MSNASRAELFRQERGNGLSHRQIAEKYGVSIQRVHQVCGQHDPDRFKVITREGCVYHNLRNWMNRNHISRRELIIRMGMEYHAEIANRVSGWLKGKSNPSKLMIDRMLKATGMTYEVLFAREEEHE